MDTDDAHRQLFSAQLKTRANVGNGKMKRSTKNIQYSMLQLDIYYPKPLSFVSNFVHSKLKPQSHSHMRTELLDGCLPVFNT